MSLGAGELQALGPVGVTRLDRPGDQL